MLNLREKLGALIPDKQEVKGSLVNLRERIGKFMNVPDISSATETLPNSSPQIAKPISRIGIDAPQDTMTPAQNVASSIINKTGTEGAVRLAKKAAKGVKKMFDESKVTATNLASGTVLQDKTGNIIDSVDKQAAAVGEALGAPEVAKAEEIPEQKNVEDNVKERNSRFIKGILYNENRGAIASGADPYQSVGPTGDLGKYQTSPTTLSDWSESWLGRKYTPEEFIADPDAQERYFDEFLKVKEKYNVSDEDAALMWHRGWGVIGTGKSKKEKEAALKEYLDRIREDDISQNYLNSFAVGTQ